MAINRRTRKVGAKARPLSQPFWLKWIVLYVVNLPTARVGLSDVVTQLTCDVLLSTYSHNVLAIVTLPVVLHALFVASIGNRPTITN